MSERKNSLQIFTNNWGWKIASVLLAAVIWFIITNYNDPVIDVYFYNVPVNIRNATALTDAGQVYEILDNTDTIPQVTITASRSIAETFTKDNIVAYAEMSEVTSRDTAPIHLSLTKNGADAVVKGSIEDVRLSIEDRKTRTIALSIETSGALSDGYMVGSVTPLQNLVRISGAASKVDQVETAVAEVDVTGFVSDISTEADIRLFDAQGVLIRDAAITQNISSVRVTVDILQTKTVPVRARITGAPAEGYLVTGEAATSEQEVMIAGDPAAIAQTTEITLEDDALDVTGRTEDLIVSVDLLNALPAGAILADAEFDPMIEVTVGIGAAAEREIAVSYGQIALENQPDDARYRLEENEETLTATLVGLEDALNALDESALRFTINVAEVASATGEAAPQFLTTTPVAQLPENVQVRAMSRVTLVRE